MKRAIKLFGFSLMMTILFVGCGTSSDDETAWLLTCCLRHNTSN